MDGSGEAAEQMIRDQERIRVLRLLAPVFRELRRCDWCLQKHEGKHDSSRIAVTYVYGESGELNERGGMLHDYRGAACDPCEKKLRFKHITHDLPYAEAIRKLLL